MDTDRRIIFLKSMKYLIMELIPFYIKNIFSKCTDVSQLKGKYSGKRCFIIATGPSLSLEDLQLVKNEYTFSMNSIVRLFDKTDWRPTFYILQDKFAYKELKPLSRYFNNTELFLTENISNSESDLKKKYSFRLRPYKDAWLLLRNKVLFSKNPSKYICDGRTVTYSIMQLAHYMGFTEIYLIGVDWNYQKGKDNHMKGLSLAHDSDAFIEDSHDMQMTAMYISYKSAENYSRKHGFRIYNAGRSKKLSVFEYVNIEDVLAR